MIATVLLCICAIFLLILCVLCKPNIQLAGEHTLSLYWIPPCLCALILLLSGLLPFSVWLDALTNDAAVNPIQILTLFLSMTVLSIYLDEVGLFRYVAAKVLTHAGKNQTRLFFLLYLTVSVLTVFTSNDIIILTFTPFLCYFCRHADIDPIPYLVCEFTAANTWSMCLIIGNPTNIYLATAAGIDFLQYVKIMFLPALCGGTVAFAVLWFLFRKSLQKEIHPTATHAYVENRTLLNIGILHLGGCTLLLVLSSYLQFDMWAICLAFACSLFVCVTVYRAIRHPNHTFLVASLRRLPWDLLPFVLSMFTLVSALSYHGVLDYLATKLDSFTDTVASGIFLYGITSTISANLVNNIPMSVLFSELLSGAQNTLGSVYATIVGSNIGAYLTPIGALAGIMWSGILRRQGTSLSFGRFVRYGGAVALPTLFATLGVLLLLV